MYQQCGKENITGERTTKKNSQRAHRTFSERELCFLCAEKRTNIVIREKTEVRNLKGLCACALVAITTLALPGQSTAQETIDLKFHSPFGESPLNLTPRLWMDEVEKRTNGKVTFTRIFGGALGKLAGQAENIKVGAFDVGQFSPVYNPGIYPLANVTSLPFMSDDPLAHAQAGHDLFRSDLVKPEFTNMNQKYMFPGLWTGIQMLSHDPIRTVEDLKKAKIRAHGGAGEILKELGITVYGIPWGELPAAAERGVVSAAIIGSPADAYAYGFGEIFSYWDDVDWFYFPMAFTINADAWEKLPDDVKLVIEEINSEMVVKGRNLMAEAEIESTQKLLEQVEVVKLEADEKAILMTVRDKAWQNWVEAREQEGKPGQAVLDQFLVLLNNYEDS
jgi:TRAP-type C4-dicarboxylate transport system substrate-binding protein